ncbi:MAG: hypothetical protein WKF36_10160 [Candidatus Nitrosocosmicus sp.]
MTKQQKLINKNPAKPTTSPIAVPITLMVVFSTLIVVFVGLATIKASYAEQTDTINATKMANASKDEVWGIVSNVDKNPDYWPISIVKSNHKTNGTVEREVTVPAPPFMDNKAHQIITINPDQYTIVENQTQGAVTGVKTISLSQAGRDVNKTEISVVWNLDLSKILGIGKGFAIGGISNSVDEALNRIANATKR